VAFGTALLVVVVVLLLLLLHTRHETPRAAPDRTGRRAALRGLVAYMARSVASTACRLGMLLRAVNGSVWCRRGDLVDLAAFEFGRFMQASDDMQGSAGPINHQVGP
jgi:hypothetical protein